jgi:outer membrane protein assembly factor BamB
MKLKYCLMLALSVLFLNLQAVTKTKSPSRKYSIVAFVGAPKPNFKKIYPNSTVQIFVNNLKLRNYLLNKLVQSGESGRVSIETLPNLKQLPYPDNFINHLVVYKKYSLSNEELLRVLVPGGTVKLPNKRTLTKKKPVGMDEWPQWMHNSDNVVVSKDRNIGPPRHIQWVAAPSWGRMHNDIEVPAPVSLILTENGRIFYDVDTGHPEAVDSVANFQFFARDAFNGKLLWKRSLKNWYTGEEYRRGNPPITIQRRVACYKDFLFITESDKAPVEKLDADTGKVLYTYPGTENAREIVISDGNLYIVSWIPKGIKKYGYNFRMGFASKYYPENTPEDQLPKKNLKRMEAETVQTVVTKINIKTHKVIWKKNDYDASLIFPHSLAVKGNYVYFKTPDHLVKVNAKTGKTIWKTKIGIPLEDFLQKSNEMKADSSPWSSYYWLTKPSPWYLNAQFVGRCIIYKNKILTTTHNKLFAVSVDDGTILWSCKSWEGFFLPPDIIPIGDKVYIGSYLGHQGFFPVDMETGQMKRHINIPKGGMVHHRCYRRIGSVDYLLSSKAGVEFHDIKAGTTSINQWTRGSCLAGFIPGNSLLYMSPHPCSCFTKVKMNGTLAYATDNGKQTDVGAIIKNRLEKGPAYGQKLDMKPLSDKDWVGYRHDMSRSGSTTAKVGSQLRLAWKKSIDTTPASLAASKDYLFVPAKDKFLLYCFETKTGNEKWVFPAGGRIDSAPTIANGFVVFGCADGWLYCVSIATGKLAWRVHPAPEQRYIGAYEKLESAWPIHGAIVVHSDKTINNGEPVVYVNAGRSSFLDKGIYLCSFDLKTGKLIKSRVIAGPYDKNGNPISSRQWSVEGVKNEVLLSDGKFLYIKDDAYDFNLEPVKSKGFPHIIGTGLSLLDPYRHHRSLWVIGKDTPYGPTVNFAGELLSVYGKKVYSFRLQNGQRNSGSLTKSLFKFGRFEIFGSTDENIGNKKLAPELRISVAKAKKDWQNYINIIVDSMVVTGADDPETGVVFLAGSKNPRTVEGFDKALDGKGESFLEVRLTKNGKSVSSYKLDAEPIHDGMAAIPGKVFVPLTDGTIMCFEGYDKK